MSARVSAFFGHFLLSALVILSLVAYVRWVWYADGLFWVEGVTDPLSVLFGVDVVLGPLLTLILYVPGKRGLKLDLTLVVVMQLAALAYGAHVLWNARPVAVAFNGNVFDVARAYEMPETTLPDWAEVGPAGGPAFVYAQPAEDPEFVLKVLLQGEPDVHLRPSHYRPLADRLEAIRPHAYRFPALQQDAAFRQAWERTLGPMPEVDEAPWVLPLYGRVADGAVVVEPGTGRVLAVLDVEVTGIKGADPDVPLPAADAPPAPDPDA